MATPSTRLVGIVITIIVAACGDSTATDAATTPDGSTPDGGFVSIPWLAEGTPPIAPPQLTPCPAGWREVVDEGLSRCEPFPGTGIAECPVGEAHFVGDPGCMTVGDPCPAGAFAEGLPSGGGVIYVSEGATGGDGSLSAPFGALLEVSFSSLASGTTVALGKGTYEGTLPLRGGVSVVGACAAETILTGVDGLAQAVVTVASGGEMAELRNVTFERPPQSAVRVERAGGGLRLEGVIVDGSMIFGVGLLEGELEVEEVVIRNTREVTEGVSGLGLWILGGRAQIVRTVFESNHYAGVFAQGEGTNVTLHDCLVRDTTTDASSRIYAYGVFVLGGATLDLRRVLLSGQRVGLAAGAATTVVTVEDLVIRESIREDDVLASAILARDEGRIEGSRVILEDNDDTGLGVGDQGSVSLSDVVIRDVRPFDGAGFEGVGVQVFDGSIELTRAVVERVVAHGILVDSARATFVDLLVRDVRSRARDELLGRGIAAQFGSVVMLERVILEQASEAGLLALDPGTEVVIADIVVRDTRARPTIGDFGRGIVAQGESRIRGSRVLVERNREVGVAATDSGAITLEDVVVTNTVSNVCETGPCADAPHGHGIAAIGGNIDLSRFEVGDSELCGAMVTPGGALNLADGEIRNAAIGACVQIDGFDFASLMQGVTYRDNGTNLEATMLPVPDPVSSL